MATEYWRDQIKNVILCSGDMVVDCLTGNYGLLIERVKKDVGYDTQSNIYFWRVQWSETQTYYKEFPNPDWIEEDGLKMSIVVGFYDLYECLK